MLTAEEQMKIICKGVDTIVNREELFKKLEKSFSEKRPLKIKLGLDPSAPDIHIGHAVVLRKVKQLQDLGHKAIIVIGDFTGKIGDPTGKSKGRVALSDEQVRENALTYCEQIFKIISKDKTEIKFNGDWLSKITLEDFIKIASNTTVARMLERDDFQNRYSNQVPIGLHEFFYPLMQAYDSVALEADIQLGGTDQTFNILMGRTLQKSFSQEPQIALFMPILEGLDGVEKMSKSLNNYIGVNEPANVMFKKVMEIPDNLIIKYYELATDEHPDEIDRIKENLQAGINPRDVKYRLAKTITLLYHSEAEVDAAMKYYNEAYSKKTIPEDIPTIKINNIKLIDLIPNLIDVGFVKSKSEFIRLVKQSGVKINGDKITEPELQLVLKDKDVLQIGKKKFLKLLK